MSDALWDAVIRDEYELANDLIRNGADINEPQRTRLDDKTTLLHSVANMDSVQRVRQVLSLGANINARDSLRRTPLHWAILMMDNYEIVELLINEGAEVDARCRKLGTPLHYAVMRDFEKSVGVFLAKGASLQMVNARGWNTLHMAVIFENGNLLRPLIDHGVEVDLEDLMGCTPLILALQKQITRIVKSLLDNGADVNRISRDGKFPLYCAAFWDSHESIYLLLEQGARINERKRDDGSTALHVACESGRVNITAVLLHFGADMHIRDATGKIPFDLLAETPSRRTIAKMLITHCVKLEALGQPSGDNYKHKVKSRTSYRKFDQICRDEIARMKNMTINAESSVSFFYILSENKEKLASLARNKEFVEAFETSNYSELFRFYGGELRHKFELAQRRGNFLLNAEDYLNKVFHNQLPACVVQKIAKYLDYGDINLTARE